MCGISGGIGISAPPKPQLLNQLDKIKHRGPDSVGTYTDGYVSMGSCRLEVVEISDGLQPFTTSDKKVTVIFNGEIYNYKNLRNQLKSLGLDFIGASEIEVIAACYKHFGINFASQLSGMFAIALFDHAEKQLILIRDRVGEKPLWYHQKDDGTLIFSSEIKALLPIIEDKSLRESAVYEVMKYGYINSPYSVYSKVLSLPPASILTFKDKKISISKYWSINFQNKFKISYQDAIDQTYDLIDKSVQSMLSAERQTGVFLSGGYDSTLITGFMVKNSTNKINTFSIGFENSDFNELSHARKVANYLGTNHHEKILKPNPESFLLEILAKLDQPFADSSYLPTFELAKFASKSVVVALGGDGGDEICAGYDRYLAATRLHRLNSISPIINYPLTQYAKFAKFSNQKQLKLATQFIKHKDLASRYNSLVALNSDENLEKLIKLEYMHKESDSRYKESFMVNSKNDLLSQLLDNDFNNYLPGDLLVKADLATMSHGLELRSPLLSYELVEWMSKIPSDFKLKGLTKKRLLKDITHKFVPKEIMNRQKMGFAIPRADWLRNELRDLSFDLLTDEKAKSRSWFNPLQMRIILNEHQKGKDRDQLIWPALCLEIWARNWL
jgi:asparagine synthase (glutamine-hydrolysing)